MDYKIYLSPPKQASNDLTYLSEAINEVAINPIGSFSAKFENKIEDYLKDTDIEKSFSINSGTSALHLSLVLLNIKKGDIILCQSSTFIATVNPVLYQNAIPVFIDSEESTWNICPVLLEKAIIEFLQEDIKPKAIIVACSYGMPCKYTELLKISIKYDIPLIEDSAAALGSFYKGIPCGGFGDFSVFSFNVNKIITGFSGGVLSVKNDKHANEVRNLVSQGKEGSVKGYNYKMSNIAAAVASSQLNELRSRVSRKREIYNTYYLKLSGCEGISFLEEPEGFFSNRWLTIIVFESKEKRDLIRRKLIEKKIETRTVWEPLHMMKRFRNMKSYCNGVSENLYHKGLCLPSGNSLLLKEQKEIITLIKSS